MAVQSNGTTGGRTNWWTLHARPLGSGFRILLGIIWLVDGTLKFTSGFVNSFPSAVQTAAAGAPGWLSGWYSFWIPTANANATLIVYTVGILELTLGVTLILGLLRKVAYIGGVALSLLIWAVPEGFGGPYQAGAGGTDVGTGVIYALVFLGLIVINAAFGPSRLSIDYFIERRLPSWSKVAEFGVAPTSVPAPDSARDSPKTPVGAS